MDTIKMADGYDYDIGSYLIHIVGRCNGQRATVSKERLIEVCEHRGIVTEDYFTKEDLIIALTELEIDDMTDEEYELYLVDLAEELQVGLSSSDYEHTFGLTHSAVKAAEKNGYLQVAGYISYRSYGKEQKSPMYSLKQFYMRDWQVHYTIFRKFSDTVGRFHK